MSAITAYYGDAGGGKSYSLFEILLAAIKLGIVVVTTLELTQAFFDDYPNAIIHFCKIKTTYQEDGNTLVKEERIVDFSKPIYGAIYILDELHEVIDLTTGKEWFKSGVAQNTLPKHIVNFVSKRRQYLNTETGRSIQIVVDTQNPVLLASWFKSHIQLAVYCIKHLEIGTTKRFKRLSYTSPSCKENKPVKADLSLRELFLKYKPEVYKYYKSHGYAQADVTVVDEKSVAKGASLLRSPVFWLVAIAFIYFWISLYDFLQGFNDYKTLKDVESSKKISAPTLVSSASASPAPKFAFPAPITSPAVPVATPAVAPALVSVLRGGGFLFKSDIGGQCFGVVIKNSKKYHYCKKDNQTYYVELKL